MVTLTATDSFGDSAATIDVTIMVTDVDEAPEIMLGRPGDNGHDSVMDYAEGNGTGMVAMYMASGPECGHGYLDAWRRRRRALQHQQHGVLTFMRRA